MNAETLRCANDLKLFNKLLQEPDVIQTNKQLDGLASKGPASIRRHLLSTSVRLTPTMSKSIHAMAEDCIERLGVNLPLELYVYASPQFNAACFKPEDDRLYVMFSSSLLEGFSESELKFVIGHELGHHVYQHHDIPIGYLLRGETKPRPRVALELFAWSRYAEISADRAGAHCAQDPNAVASSLFKLASGLTGKSIEFNLDDFLAQVDDMQVVDAEPGQGSPKEDWFATHPFSPLRVKALQLFEQSVLSARGKVSVDELEVGVQGLMSLMEPNYMEGKTDAAEAMRRALFAGAIAVANASKGISEQEIQVFNDFFGRDAFSEKLNVEKLKQQLPERAKKVASLASQSQRMQVLRDLCLVAQADGKVTAKERKLLVSISQQLDVPDAFVDQVLASSVELD